ncbi:antibiotic biosynthesis monooxygenase [Mycolicibacterium sp. 018/SC-01/001]|uniref:antibiotic biosynthesis monooxygenase family protein n=1 Tax=Mycolicibacterium sp. 018/SC-01/001 TaxID=2592069 RepID=UPI0011815FF0|nr:antibiotic biosynthesis monooxygenase family protein [Mycolicibacterium sp. 018/SC-01/001]TRW81424.1 antibiotic biosynthesis monooxygenase [Mycolicibacterium sp. 018/SC-01/001]
MPTIQQHSPYATLINVFSVAPARAEELAAVLTHATDEVMRHVPGFGSASIHISLDRTRVVNYAQWDSAESFLAMQDNPVAREHMTAAAAIADSFSPHLYEVVSVHQRG